MSTTLPEIFTGEQLANFDAFYSAVSTGAWGEETPAALTEIGAALAASGVTTGTYFSLVDQYTKAVAACDGATQYQLLRRIADGISRMAYENARKQLSFRVRRFAEHPDFSFLRDNLRVEDRAVLTLGGPQRKPEVGMQASSGRRQPIDDATFTRQILERQTEPGAKPLERGDPLYERLLGVIDRQVMERSDIYGIPKLPEIFAELRAGCPVPSVRLMNFTGSNYAVDIVKNGYDPHKKTRKELYDLGGSLARLLAMRDVPGRYRDRDSTEGTIFFKLTHTSEAEVSQFIHYGLPNNHGEVVVSLEHEMPMLTFLTFLAATPGYAYSGDLEFTIMGEGTALFNIMIQRMPHQVSTRVVVHSFPNTPEARSSIDALLSNGATVYFDLGTSHLSDESNDDEDFIRNEFRECGSDFFDEYLSTSMSTDDVVSFIINHSGEIPRGPVGTDKYNLGHFLYYLLHFPSERTQQYFERMFERNPEMARYAEEFYSSIPEYTLPILRRWESEWRSPSESAKGFIRRTIEKALEIKQRFSGKTFKPGEQLP